jgi:hypothetical protein
MVLNVEIEELLVHLKDHLVIEVVGVGIGVGFECKNSPSPAGRHQHPVLAKPEEHLVGR